MKKKINKKVKVPPGSFGSHYNNQDPASCPVLSCPVLSIQQVTWNLLIPADIRKVCVRSRTQKELKTQGPEFQGPAWYTFVASSSHHYSSLQHFALNLDGHEIPSSPSIRNLGVIFDSSMTMAEHITNLSPSINWQLPNLNRIRKFLDTDTCHNIVRTLILSKLDYCNSLLYGIDKNISIIFKFFKTYVLG